MMDDADIYGTTTSRYYDRVYELLRDPSGDLEFYRKLARDAQGPVLELGCGTGRALLAIAVEGIPSSGGAAMRSVPFGVSFMSMSALCASASRRGTRAMRS